MMFLHRFSKTSHPCRIPLLFLFLALFFVPVYAGETDPLAPAWDDAATLLIEEAHDAFHLARESGKGDAREADYGLAITLLNIQPKTARNIRESESLLENVRAANPNDELGVASLYFLARIAQYHQRTPDLPRALKLYRQLIQEHPEHFLAQLAITKLAILQLFGSADITAKQEALVELEKSASRLTNPSARCNFDLVVGTACIRYGLNDEVALRRLVEADQLGIPIRLLASHVVLRIGNLALRLGRKEMAAIYFERFIKEYPRDNRVYMARLKLAELKPGSR